MGVKALPLHHQLERNKFMESLSFHWDLAANHDSITTPHPPQPTTANIRPIT